MRVVSQSGRVWREGCRCCFQPRGDRNEFRSDRDMQLETTQVLALSTVKVLGIDNLSWYPGCYLP